MPYPLPTSELARCAALASYAIVDTPPEQVFDDLVNLAARLSGANVAAVNLLDGDIVWLKAAHGVQNARCRANMPCALMRLCSRNSHLLSPI